MHLEQNISGPIAVIGDVHGQVDQLGRVLEQLRELPDYQRRWIVFIGDLVDRGPDPCGAINLVLELMTEHPLTTVVSGNHELAMGAALGLLDTPDYSDWSGRWIDHYGSEQTFLSYGVDDIGNLDALKAEIPAEHAELLAALPWSVEHPEYFFVHAGLDPHTSFQIQRQILSHRDFTLNRPQWLCSKSVPFQDPPPDCPITVVSGHVRVPQVQFNKRRILIDTTGGEGGNLSCVLLPENKVIQSDSPMWQAKIAEPVAAPKKRGWLW